MGYLRATGEVFMRYRYLLANLVQRDITVKYRRSVLGIVWSVLNPLLMMLVMTFVFQYLFTNMIGDPALWKPVSVTGLPPNFSVYILSGQLMFNFFNEATNMALDSVTGNAALIKKVYIPKYIFPLEKVIFSLINTLSSMIALVGVILFVGAPVTGWFLLFPISLTLLFVFNLGAGLILSSVVVFFRDIKHLYGVFVLALTYMTPIFYPESIFAQGSPVFAVVRLNPLYWYVGLFRELVLYGNPPSMQQWLITGGWALFALVTGLLIFHKTQDRFILYI